MIYSTTWMYLKKFLPTKTEDTKGRYWMISFLWHQILLKLIYIRYWGWADWREMDAMELSGLMHMFYFLVSRDNVLPWCYMGVDNCQNSSSCPPNMCAFYCILIYLFFLIFTFFIFLIFFFSSAKTAKEMIYCTRYIQPQLRRELVHSYHRSKAIKGTALIWAR